MSLSTAASIRPLPHSMPAFAENLEHFKNSIKESYLKCREKTDSKFQENAGLLFENVPVETAVLRNHKMDTMYDPEHACLSVHIKQVGFNTTCFENNLRTIYTRTGKEYQILKQMGLHFQEHGQAKLWFLSCANYP